MAKKELVPAKQEKARERIKNFRSELVDYRQYFDRLKKDREDSVSVSPRFPLSLPYSQAAGRLLTRSTNPANRAQPRRTPRPTPPPDRHARKPLCAVLAPQRLPLRPSSGDVTVVRHFAGGPHARIARVARAKLHGEHQRTAGRTPRARPGRAGRSGPAAGDTQGHSAEAVQRRQHAGRQRRNDPHGGAEGQAGQMDLLGRRRAFLRLLLARHPFLEVKSGSRKQEGEVGRRCKGENSRMPSYGISKKEKNLSHKNLHPNQWESVFFPLDLFIYLPPPPNLQAMAINHTSPARHGPLQLSVRWKGSQG